MCQALLEIMEPEINKIKENVKEEVTREVTEEVTREVTKEVTRGVIREGITNTIMALRDCGQTEDIIRQIISKAYNLSFQETERYL